MKFARESHADGEGNLARWRNKSAALFTHFLTQKCTPLSRVQPEGGDEEEEEPAEFGQEEGAEDEARDVARARGHLLLRRLLLLVAIVGGTLIQQRLCKALRWKDSFRVRFVRVQPADIG